MSNKSISSTTFCRLKFLNLSTSKHVYIRWSKKKIHIWNKYEPYPRPSLNIIYFNHQFDDSEDQTWNHIIYIDGPGLFFSIKIRPKTKNNFIGGSGKTTLLKKIVQHFRENNQTVLPVAASGIAAQLIQKGRTAHNRFKIPIEGKSQVIN